MSSTNKSHNVLYNSDITDYSVEYMSSVFPNGGRFCLHEKNDKFIQCMLIYLPPLTIYPKHYHCTTKEIYILIDGAFNITTYTDNLEIQSNLELKKGKLCTYKLPEKIIHSMTSGPAGAVFVEIKPGKFLASDTIKI